MTDSAQARSARAARIEAKRRHASSPLIRKLYALGARRLARSLCHRLEGRLMLSDTWRAILADHHGVHIGAYSYGDILTPGILPRGTRVGRYCSVGTGLIVRRRDHPVTRPVLHAMFYNKALGLVDQDTIAADTDNPLTIGHDVWIADRVTILSGCTQIGNGAVLAAGSVVTKDVPAYTLVGGVPAKSLKQRFTDARIEQIEDTQWWDMDLPDLVAQRPFPDLFGPDR